MLALTSLLALTLFQTEPEIRIVAGTVVNEAGEPIADAELMLPVSFRGTPLAEGKTDAEGRFRLEVPAKWLVKPPHRNSHSIWVHHPDYALGVGSAWKAMFLELKDGAPPVQTEITLRKSQVLKIIVKDPKGVPVSNIEVQPYHMKAPASIEWIPKRFRKLMTVKANAKGMLLLPRVRHDDIYSIRALSAEFGTQEFRLPEEERNRKIDLQLAAVGSIQGQFTAENPGWLKGVSLHITSRFDAYPETGRSPGRGISGLIEIGPDGKFSIPAIAAGVLMIDASSDEKHPARLKLPGREEKLHPAKTMLMKIPLVAATPVRGQVVDSNKQPIPNATVYIRYGQQRQGDHVVTGKDGRYSGFVLPGSCYTQIISVAGFGSWTQKGSPWQDRFDVPDQRETFDMPEITILRQQVTTGMLVDQDDKPLANYSVMAVVGNKISGRSETDADGKFKIMLAPAEELDSFSVSSKADRKSPRLGAEVVRKKPTLLLRVTLEK